MIYKNVLENVGNNPTVELKLKDLDNINAFAKLEYYNPSGSVKDRAAYYILTTMLKKNVIGKDTTIIESSSGNFGIALSYYCRKLGLKFICVVDPCITPVNETIIRNNKATIVKVTEPDENKGYLLNRIRKVKEIQNSISNSYWVNQYANPYNAKAYYNTLAIELLEDIGKLDYVFLGVSSGGTITGVSRKIKEKSPNTKVIAVDIKGSIVFGNYSKKRYIPGIGSSMKPEILKSAYVDDFIMMSEFESVKGCYDLLDENYVFAGGSSGSVYAAIKKYFKNKRITKEINVAMICADRGDRYTATIYNPNWVKEFIEKDKEPVLV